LVLAAAALLVALAGLAYVGSRFLIAPTIVPTPSVAPEPSRASALVTIDRNLYAWRWGDMSAVSRLYANEPWLHVVGESRGLEQDHFEIRDGARGYVYWEVKGPVFGQAAYWAHAFVAGIWDPGSYGFSAYRLDREARIEVEWMLVRANTIRASHENLSAGFAPDEILTFLNGCAGARDTGDRTTVLDCYAPDAAVLISAGSPDGAWTEHYDGTPAITGWLDGPTAYVGLTRTDRGAMIGDIVAYSFEGSSSTDCRAGIDVFELNADRTRILNQWTFCGP
jgi:hypothetical protein